MLQGVLLTTRDIIRLEKHHNDLVLRTDSPRNCCPAYRQ